MKCVICEIEVLIEKNSIVCSEKCGAVRLKLMEIGDKYFPTRGCDNCWGDLHQGCLGQCRKEFSERLEFNKDLWSIIRIIYSPKRD